MHPRVIRKCVFAARLKSAGVTDVLPQALHVAILLVHLEFIVGVGEEAANPADKLGLFFVHGITVIDQGLGAVAGLATDDANVGAVVSSFVANQAFKVSEGAATVWETTGEILPSLVEVRQPNSLGLRGWFGRVQVGVVGVFFEAVFI